MTCNDLEQQEAIRKTWDKCNNPGKIKDYLERYETALINPEQRKT